MYRDKKIIVVMPAYNAAQTLRKTYDEVMDQGIKHGLGCLHTALTFRLAKINFITSKLFPDQE